MARAPTAYLKEAKIAELASELREQGYEVIASEPPDTSFDLVALRGQERLAIEVKVRSELREYAKQIAELRRQAAEKGFTAFHLVVVNPPRTIDIQIDGLEGALYAHLGNDFPANLNEISSRTALEDVHSVEIDELPISTEGARVTGSAVVEVQLSCAGGNERDGLTYTTDFPLEFDVLVGKDLSDLRIERTYELSVDTSSFYD